MHYYIVISLVQKGHLCDISCNVKFSLLVYFVVKFGITPILNNIHVVLRFILKRHKKAYAGLDLDSSVDY